LTEKSEGYPEKLFGSLFVRLGQSNKPPHGVCSFDCVDENNDLDPFTHLNNGVFLPKEF
jgi:hypothetical protein